MNTKMRRREFLCAAAVIPLAGTTKLQHGTGGPRIIRHQTIYGTDGWHQDTVFDHCHFARQLSGRIERCVFIHCTNGGSSASNMFMWWHDGRTTVAGCSFIGKQCGHVDAMAVWRSTVDTKGEVR